MSDTEGGRQFRAAWIAGVRRHFPGEPKPGYVSGWDEMPEWERSAAGAVHAQVRDLIEASEGGAAKLSREQKSRFVAISWTAQMYRAFADPKPGYVADWSELPEWQRETDADIFEAIEVERH
ncbi:MULTISPECIES: hypothetical protein [unclassified Streptomyces]|uniref:Uncharacterized protein n=1 Tax=Streptomyces evansiae TaxID=3075535 RepID=A0ABU2R3R9_9ACTN|nr:MULTISPECIES: hypothetical protein [unclassified Streptomyces]EFL02176.1 conserved hypothetical protein [Streptomyces sp. SPB78]MDT0410345.1 hypothetical protein [Streptomyces sp. DSM 41979]MDT0423816.1 hypothetical protein [Streptomyces sp. DSM 41859]MYQ61182.1 hypothetical protein [Streptomyces sp. SID4926]MYR30089.1 hypothetical protein [Streptomyces sp. SID4945]